jgi:hypothetical protein
VRGPSNGGAVEERGGEVRGRGGQQAERLVIGGTRETEGRRGAEGREAYGEVERENGGERLSWSHSCRQLL